jgi:putative transposase
MSAPLEITRRDYTSAELRGLSGRCADGAQVRRLLVLALVLNGYSQTEAAALSGMDRQTLRDWVSVLPSPPLSPRGDRRV